MGKYIRKSRGKYIRSVVAAQSRKNKKHKNKKSKSKNEQGKSEMVYINSIDKITSQKQILSNKDPKFTEQGNTRTRSNPMDAITIKLSEQYNEMSGQYNEMSEQYSDHHHIIQEFGQCPPDSRELPPLSGNNDDDNHHDLDELAEHCPAEPNGRTLIMTENIRKLQCAPDHASKPASGNGDALSRSNSASRIEMPVPHEGLIAIDKQSITFERTSDIDTMLLFDRVDPTTTYHAEAASSSGEERTHETLILEMNNYSTAPLSQVHYSSYTSKFDSRKIGSMHKRASSSCSSSSVRARALLEIEIEEFFFEAEQRERERFVEKYNFEPLHDIPLPGRYEWVPISSLSPD